MQPNLQQPQISIRKKRSFKKHWVLLPLLATYIATIVWHTNKPLPKGVSYEGEVHRVQNVGFLYDLTYEKGSKMVKEQMIFERIYKAIEEADKFVVIDMFLFNNYKSKDSKAPDISDKLTNTIISAKQKNPDLQVFFISDEVNTTYGSHKSQLLEKLKANGVHVTLSNMKPLRDSMPLYSGAWRMFGQWFESSENGWLKNPMSDYAPDVTVRSYFKLLNVKANHRKVLATDKTAIISSANPHDGSGDHSNTAFEVQGNIIGDILKAEQAVVQLSSDAKLPTYKREPMQGDIAVQFLTEGKTYQHILQALDHAKKGDTVWMGMFYLADRSIVDGLVGAAEHGVAVRLILDPNENAFGREKIGLPNRPVVKELRDRTDGDIKVRWYNTQKEQYHPKMLMIESEQNTIIGGSANFTKRNLDDLNLEADIKIVAAPNEKVMQDITAYFNRLWNNEGAKFTLDVEAYQSEMTVFKQALYALQKILHLTTY